MTQGRAPDRFIVRSITGYSEGQPRREATSYWIRDLDYARVVATYYSEMGEQRNRDNDTWARRLRAEARARHLNEKHRRWLHSGRWLDET